MRNKIIKRFNRIWIDDGDTLRSTDEQGYTAITWKFGEIHQCCYAVPNPNGPAEKEVTFGLEPCKTRNEAMKKALAHIETHKSASVESAEDFIQRTHKNWPSLYKYRSSLLDHLFFVIGNGYDWLNGRMVCNNPEDSSEALHIERRPPLIDEETQAMLERVLDRYTTDPAIPEDLRENLKELLRTPEQRIEDVKILSGQVPIEEPDPNSKIDLYPICKDYSKIWTVPVDVTDDWLAVCAEAIRLVQKRNGNKQNKGQAKALRAHYTKMFGQRFAKLE